MLCVGDVVVCRFVCLLVMCLLVVIFGSMFVGFGFCICLAVTFFGLCLGWLLFWFDWFGLGDFRV